MTYRDLRDGESMDLIEEEMRAPHPQQVRRRNVAPNWGRSYPLSTIYGFEQEFARVELPVPRDITIMLGDPASAFMASYAPTCSLQYGIGGTAGITTLDASLLGTVYHVVAQSIVVRAIMPPTEVDPTLLFATNARFQAMIGIGRPSCCVTSTQTFTPSVAPVVPELFRLLPWVTRVSMQLLSDPAGTETRAIKWATRTDFNDNTHTEDQIVPVSAFAGGGLYVPKKDLNALVFEDPESESYVVSITQYWEL